MGVKMPTKLKPIVIDEEKLYFSLSYDIGEYDCGIWWLQVYDNNHNIIYDEPFASCMFTYCKGEKKKIRETLKKIIKYNILYPKGLIL